MSLISLYWFPPLLLFQSTWSLLDVHCKQQKCSPVFPSLYQLGLLFLLQRTEGGGLSCLHDNHVSLGKLLVVKDLLRAGGRVVFLLENLTSHFPSFQCNFLIVSFFLCLHIMLCPKATHSKPDFINKEPYPPRSFWHWHIVSPPPPLFCVNFNFVSSSPIP